MTTLSQVIGKIFQPRVCEDCKSPYIPKGPAAKFCIICAPKHAKQVKAKSVYEYRKRIGVQVGVGKGGANTSGVDDGQYKTGIKYFQKRRGEIKLERRYCERCKKDLSTARSGQWAVHHRDRNRANNVDTNFELLCKKCHQMEHECTSNLPIKGATTISQESRE